MIQKSSRKAIVLAGAVAMFGLVMSASAFTLATHADPSSNGLTPMFTFDGTTLTGGWVLPGLELEVPGGPVTFPDVQVSMTAVTSTLPVPIFPGVSAYVMSAGMITFSNLANPNILTIDFHQALLTPFSFGAADFVTLDPADDVVVTFSGLIVPPNYTTPPNDESDSFAFSFANLVGTFDDFTVTAAFTSSAAVSGVPEPTGTALLLIGGLPLMLRRRIVSA